MGPLLRGALLALLLAAPLRAQNGTELAPPQTDLNAALLAFANTHQLDLLFDPLLVAGLTTDCVAPSPEVEAGLTCLLRATPLSFQRLPSGTYVVKRRPPVPTAPGLVEGVVLDAETRQPIPNVHIYLQDTARGIATNLDGQFRLSALPPNRYVLRITHVGYLPQSQTVHVMTGSEHALRLSLVPRPVRIEPVIVESSTSLADPQARVWDGFDRPAPTGLGGSDAVRDLNTLMGVRVGDAMADVHLQGGGTGEHQFRLDGVPIFEPVHLRGLVGAFNPFALSKITVHKAGFGVREGSQIAGVIEAQHRLEGTENSRLDAQVDPLSLNLRAHGHTGGQRLGARGTYMATFRRSLWGLYEPSTLRDVLRGWNRPDPFLSQASGLSVALDEVAQSAVLSVQDSLALAPLNEPRLGFTDVHAAARWQWADQHTLYASAYGGWNEMNGQDLTVGIDTVSQSARPNEDTYRWRNVTGQVQWTSILSPTLYSTVQARGSQYRLAHTYGALEEGTVRGAQVLGPEGLQEREFRLVNEVRPADDGNRIEEWAVEGSLLMAQPQGTSLEVGAELIYGVHRFTVDAFGGASDSTLIQDAFRGVRAAAYGEWTQPLGTDVRLVTGLRTTVLPRDGRSFTYAEPRLELRLDRPAGAVGPWSVRAATGLYRQMVNQFAISSFSPSTLLSSIRFWLPVDPTVMAPAKAVHGALEAGWQPVPRLYVRAEGYYKHQPHIPTVDYTKLWDNLRSPKTDIQQDDYLSSERGQAYGSSFMVTYERPRISVSARYDWTVSERTSPILPDSLGEVPVSWNEPSRVELGLNAAPAPGVAALVRWRGSWGRRWGFRQSYYDYLASDSLLTGAFGTFDFRDPSAHRLPAFVQLDVGLAYTYAFEPLVLQVRLDVMNALNRQNVEFWSMDGWDLDAGRFERGPRYSFPRITSLALRVQW